MSLVPKITHLEGEEQAVSNGLIPDQIEVEIYDGKIFVEWDPDATVTPLGQLPYPVFKSSLEAQGQNLPRYIQQEFDDFLQCGRLE